MYRTETEISTSGTSEIEMLCSFPGDKNAATLLGALDSAYLFAYAASMFLR